MSMPRKSELLDLFSGGGGSGVGYLRAGFAVAGVDSGDHLECPFPWRRMDAFDALAEAIAMSDEPGRGWAVITASPPCHDHTTLRFTSGKTHDTGWMLGATLGMLREWVERVPGKAYVVENVERNSEIDRRRAILVCGSEFGMQMVADDGQLRQLRRHRWFESNVPLARSGDCRHAALTMGVYGAGRGGNGKGWKGSAADRQTIMGINWMPFTALSQAIPPRYTEHIGRQVARWLEAHNAAQV